MILDFSDKQKKLAGEASTVVIYHNKDMDGKMGAAIAYMGLPLEPTYFLGMNYEPVTAEDLMDAFPKMERLLLIDHSLPAHRIVILIKSQIKVYLLDHHKSAIDSIHELVEKECNEIDRNLYFYDYSTTEKSGSMIAWEFFYPSEDAPEHVRLVDTYDRWQTDSFRWKTANKFNSGLYLQEDTAFDSDMWSTLFAVDGNEDAAASLFTSILSAGEAALIFSEKKATYDSNSWGGTLHWNGIRFLALNTSGNSACAEPAFNPDLHEAILLFRWSPSFKKWKISLFHCSKAPCDTDLSKIAFMYGGGGHPGACGFTCDELPFELTSIEPLK